MSARVFESAKIFDRAPAVLTAVGLLFTALSMTASAQDEAEPQKPTTTKTSTTADDPLAPSAAAPDALLGGPPKVERRRPGVRGAVVSSPAYIDPSRIAPPTLNDLFACEPTLEVGGVDYSAAPCAPPISDRWRLAESLKLVRPRWWDPYNQNTLKGDRPIWGTNDWFFVATGVSDTVVEPRSFPVPVGVQTTNRPGALDVFGASDSFVFAQTLIASGAFIKGSTAYKPQDLEFRVALAANYNYVEVEELRILDVEPTEGDTRQDFFVGVQEAFVDYHIRNVSKRYDFDSIRVGIQPYNTDFRGFLFQDNQLGARLFGTRDNNRLQYNLAAFARLEKDTNSGLNDVTTSVRDDYLLIASLYRQDLPFPGLTSQATVVHNINRERDDVTLDENGFPVRPALIGDLRPREYDVTYLGYNTDGRIGRINVTGSAYYGFGENRNSNFTSEAADISAYFLAAEASYDRDWIRVRGSALHASGDSDPFDGEENGFDAIFENPQFAGADTSYWMRQSIPLIGGGRAIALNGRNGLLNSLRSSKEQGQSNFINPGLNLLGVGADFDVTPEFRFTVNTNHLSFDDVSSLEALRVEGGIGSQIGWDLSASAIYRPAFTQNIVLRLSGAVLEPADDFQAIYSDSERDERYLSVLANAVMTY